MIARVVKQMCADAGLRVGTNPENLAALRLHQWGHSFQQQHRVGRYRLDFAMPAARIAIEVDGPHHQRPDTAVKDAFRDQWLRDEGWIVLRVNAGATLEHQLANVSALLRALGGEGA